MSTGSRYISPLATEYQKQPREPSIPPFHIPYMFNAADRRSLKQCRGSESSLFRLTHSPDTHLSISHRYLSSVGNQIIIQSKLNSVYRPNSLGRPAGCANPGEAYRLSGPSTRHGPVQSIALKSAIGISTVGHAHNSQPRPIRSTCYSNV